MFEINNVQKLYSEDDERYIKIVEEFANENVGEIFPNSNAFHASVVISNIIRTSKEEVIIFDDDLSGDIALKYPNFMFELEKFLLNKKKLKIIIKKNKNSNVQNFTEFECLLKELSNKYKDYIEIKKLKENSSFEEELKKEFNNKEIYFTIGDKSKIRIEFDYNNINNSSQERKAFCSFKNLEYSNKILPIFNKHYKSEVNIENQSFVNYF